MTDSTLDTFLQIFSSLFNEGTVITAACKFRDLEEWSSMQALIVIAAIDEHFGVTIPERDFRNAHTVSDLYQLTVR